MIKIIWKKSFRRMIRKMQRVQREETIEKLKELAIEDQVAYLNGIDDGYYMACEDILKWIEKRK